MREFAFRGEVEMERAAAIRAMEVFMVEDAEREKVIVEEIEELSCELEKVRGSIQANHEFRRRILDADDRIVTSPHEGTVREHVTGTAESIIRSEGPQHRLLLLEMIEASGVIVGGKKPLANMSAYLSRDDRFHASGDGVWSLVGEQEQAGEIAAD